MMRRSQHHVRTYRGDDDADDENDDDDSDDDDDHNETHYRGDHDVPLPSHGPQTRLDIPRPLITQSHRHGWTYQGL